MGLVFNLPDIVIWRVHIKISISIHLSSATYNSDAGVRIGMYVDDVVQTQLAAGPTSNQYGQKYLIWDKIYMTEIVANGGFGAAATTTSLYTMFKEYDVKSHRKIGLQDELWMQLVSEGNVVMDTFDLTYSVLLKVPG